MLRGIAPALLILVGLVLGTDARGASVPAFFWSGRRVFVGGKANALEAATPRSLVNVIERMAGSPSAAAASPGAELHHYVDHAALSGNDDVVGGLPRLVVVLRHAHSAAQLRSTGVLGGIEAAVRGARSALVVPHSYPASGAAALREELRTALPPLQYASAADLTGGGEDEEEGSEWWLQTKLKLRDAADAAGQSPPIVTFVDAAAMDAAQLQLVSERVANATSGSFVALYAPDAQPIDAAAVAATPASRAGERRLLGFPLPYDPFPLPNSAGGGGGAWSCPLGENYDTVSGACFRYISITPNVLFGIAVTIFLIAVTWIGLGCLVQVRTPGYLDQQVDEKVAKERARLLRGKEF